jgi:hypothetical protein
MAQEQNYGSGKIKLTFSKTLDILKPYVRSRFMDQLKSVWIIIAYLVLFQIVLLQLPIVYSLMIGFGVLIVILGLMFFMEGLVLGLMPFGEILGAKLPVKSSLPVILIFSFLLGVGATFAEPAIAVLKAAGSGVQPSKAPLLYSLLNEFSGQLVLSVGAGVGIAVLLGVLRFMYGWSLKAFIIPSIIILSGITLWAHYNDILNPIIGLAWDCGGVTTGPVTVPLVLALGIGVCRVVNTGDSSSAGFGIVTLASILPVLAVLTLGSCHYFAKDYYGAENFTGTKIVEQTAASEAPPSAATFDFGKFTAKDLEQFKKTGEISGNYLVTYKSDSIKLVDGKIKIANPTVIYKKEVKNTVSTDNVKKWDTQSNLWQMTLDSIIAALQAIIPLCLFLFVVLRFLLREKVPYADEISIGIFFAVLGMAIFGLGISLGLTPLGTQLGFNIPSAFARIQPWGLEGHQGPLFSAGLGGKLVAIVFGFFLGYGATLAEPALNALGVTVEKITVGSFKKSLLMQTVAVGVGLGIALGVLKIAYNIPLTYLLIPPYFLLIPLTLMSSESFVNFGWDSAGVTTGPITVPLVLAMGLGIGANVPGVIDGFGILALASVTPIIAVLTVGMIASRGNKPSQTNL